MFDSEEIKALKEKHKEELTHKKNTKKSISKLKEYLNTFDFKEFMTFFIPKNFNEVKYLIKPLPFSNSNKKAIGGINIYFSKHLSKDIKLNCCMNFKDDCPVCDASTIKKFDFVIFPVYVLSNSLTDFYKKQIKLIEIPADDWENHVFPHIEKFYQTDLILSLNIKKDGYAYSYTYKEQSFIIPELTKEEILNKTFEYETTKNYLYNPKAYVDTFNIELNTKDLVVKEKPY
jgi:hypothetical protein